MSLVREKKKKKRAIEPHERCLLYKMKESISLYKDKMKRTIKIRDLWDYFQYISQEQVFLVC